MTAPRPATIRTSSSCCRNASPICTRAAPAPLTGKPISSLIRHIFGSVGRQLATLSRYRIEHAERLQLPVASANFISRQFQPKDALLATKLPLSDGGQLTVFNTHLERASQPDDTLQAQVSAVAKVLDKYESQGLPWLIGGDFNLLPLGQYRRLPAEQRTPYSADSELHLLWDKYPMIPTNNEASGIDRAQWLTHYPNDPGLNGPDRTVDYLFYSPKIKRVEATVRQDDTLRISDHLPVIARFLLPRHSITNTSRVGAAAGCDLLIFKNNIKRSLACGSSYSGINALLRGRHAATRRSAVSCR